MTRKTRRKNRNKWRTRKSCCWNMKKKQIKGMMTQENRNRKIKLIQTKGGDGDKTRRKDETKRQIQTRKEEKSWGSCGPASCSSFIHLFFWTSETSETASPLSHQTPRTGMFRNEGRKQAFKIRSKTFPTAKEPEGLQTKQFKSIRNRPLNIFRGYLFISYSNFQKIIV